MTAPLEGMHKLNSHASGTPAADGKHVFVTFFETDATSQERGEPGEMVVDQFDVHLPSELPPGEYRLVTGMYNFDSGQRLPVFNAAGESPGDNLIELTTVNIP